METSARIHICICGNRKVFTSVLLTMLSIAEFTSEPVAVHLLTMDLSELDSRFLPVTEDERVILEEALQSGNPASSVALLDGRAAYMRLLHGGKNEKNHYTPYAMGRLLLTEFDLPDTVLYIDSDVMCCADLAALYEIDLEGYEFAASLDVMGKFWIRRDYCNSGVMLINLKEARRTHLFERARERVCKRRMAFPDQTALNRLVKKKRILPRRFNEQRAVRKDTVLKHFCQGIRWLPFFKVYNIKQYEVGKVHRNLKITHFDGVYRNYQTLAEKYGLMQLQ